MSSLILHRFHEWHPATEGPSRRVVASLTARSTYRTLRASIV
jgi:hypothetical protein